MATVKTKHDPFVIPTPSHYSRGTVDAGINNPNVNIDRVRFDIYTYRKLKTQTPGNDKWFLIDAANDFLATLDNDERDYLCRLFIRMKRECLCIVNADTIFNHLNIISDRIVKVFGKLNLVPRAVAFAKSNTKIQYISMENQGKRSHDKPELTWEEDQYLTLSGLAIIFKLMFPVFGEIIRCISRVDDNTNEGKEIYAASIMEKVIILAEPDIYAKLQFYVANVVSKKIDKDVIAAMYGITETAINKRCLAIVLIKNLVNFDLYDTKNMITYIHVSVTKAATTNYNKKSTTHYSDYDSLKVGGEDEGNSSLIDESVAIFADKAEKRPLIIQAVTRAIEQNLAINHFRSDIFDDAVAYYKTHLPLPTKLNEFLIGLFISKEVGCAYAVRYLDNSLFIMLTVLVQLFMARTGFERLVPMLSLVETTIVRPIEVVTNSIMIDRGHGSAYSYLKAEMDHLNKFINVAAYLDKFADYIVATEFEYNVAPSIAGLINIHKPNSEGYWRYDKDVLALMFEFTYQMLIKPNRIIDDVENGG